VAAGLPAIVAIYNQAIDTRCCTGDTERFTAESRTPWFESHSSNDKTPIFVYETDDGVVAYGAISPYRGGRQAFERVGEVCYYVDFNHHGKGIGGKLSGHLIAAAKELNYTHLLAILLSCNDKSISLLEKNNFTLWGKLPDIACIDGNIYSHLYYGLSL
jgi:phosphinothricin acetyltransferase